MLPRSSRIREDHRPHVRDAVSAKNMCSVRHRPIPSRRMCVLDGIARYIGNSAHSNLAERFGPFHQLCRSASSDEASSVLSFPLITRPVVPSSEIQFPP